MEVVHGEKGDEPSQLCENCSRVLKEGNCHFKEVSVTVSTCDTRRQQPVAIVLLLVLGTLCY